jgi:hypothetical protein
MSYRVFNTHEYIKALMKVGVKEKQAEVIVKGLLESREYDFAKLATKEQLDSIRNELKVDIATSHANILKLVIPLFLTIIGMVATILFKVLSH